jgi:hypothetical protein
VNGGTLAANRIIAAGGLSILNMNGGTLFLTNNAGQPGTPLASVNLTNSTVHLNLDGNLVGTNLVASALSAGGVTTLQIDSVTNITGAGASFPLLCDLCGFLGKFHPGANTWRIPWNSGQQFRSKPNRPNPGHHGSNYQQHFYFGRPFVLQRDQWPLEPDLLSALVDQYHAPGLTVDAGGNQHFRPRGLLNSEYCFDARHTPAVLPPPSAMN